MADNLFGTLHTPLKPLTYTGIDTDSVDVIVDNLNRVISAHVQPNVLETIEGNVKGLIAARERLATLEKEADEIKDDIKSKYEYINDVIYNLRNDLDNHFKDIEATITSLDEKVDDNTLQLEHKIKDNFNTLDEKIDSNYNELNLNIENVNSSLNNKIDEEVANLNTLINNSTSALDTRIDSEVSMIDSEVSIINSKIDNINYNVSESKSNLEEFKKDVADTYYTIANANGLNDNFTQEIDTIKTTYATKDELGKESTSLIEYVDEKVLELVAGEVEFASLATKEELKEVSDNLGILESSIGVIPQDKTLKEEIWETFATKSEIPDVSEYIKEDDLNKALTNYYNKTEIEDKLKDLPTGGGSSDIDENAVNELINNALSNIIWIEATLTEDDLSND